MIHTKNLFHLIGLFAAFIAHSLAANAAIVDLGTASSYAVLAGTSITNVGTTVISGEVGVSTGTSITGFNPSGTVVNGTLHSNDLLTQLAKADLQVAYDNAAAQTCTTDLTAGGVLGGLTLTPGVYCFDSTADLTGTLTLDSTNDPNGSYLFQIGTSLTTATASMIQFLGTNDGSNVFFQIGESATLGTDTVFVGNILANTSITLITRASIDCGSALAINGAVTLGTNIINVCAAAETGVPEPTTYAMFLVAAGVVCCKRIRSRRR